MHASIYQGYPIRVRKAVVADLRAGKSTRQAAYRNGVSQWTARYWATLYGVQLRSMPGYTEEQWAERARDAAAMSAEAWCAKYGVTRKQHGRALKRLAEVRRAG